MKKSIILFTILLCTFGIIGCTNTNQDGVAVKTFKKGIDTINKSKALTDITNASVVASFLARAYSEGKIANYAENQELTEQSEYGKALLSIPKCQANSEFKFFVSVSADGLIKVKAGKDSSTAVLLFPRHEKLDPPYDVLNN
ncbi:MAG: hypothetical protein ACM3UU_10545 [Ignavibacteriales bacterium]